MKKEAVVERAASAACLGRRWELLRRGLVIGVGELLVLRRWFPLSGIGGRRGKEKEEGGGATGRKGGGTTAVRST